MPPNGEVLVTPARGGKLTVDRVTVEFPAGAVDRDLTLRIAVKDLPPSPGYARFKYAFDLEGRDRAVPQAPPVTSFRRPPRVLVDTRGLGLTEDEERRNLVWRYDEGDRRWKPLPLMPRPGAGVVVVETEHFSGFAMGPTSDPIPPAPPGLQAYQSDLLTGSARTAYAIEVPPGMGGLTPRLEIPYSTLVLDEMNRAYAQNQSKDNAAFDKQASWVGLGFDFEPGCIVAPSADGPRYLRIGGRSSRIVQDQPDGSWRTEDDWFWKALFITPSMQQPSGPYEAKTTGSGHYWLVWDNDGTEYRLGFTLHSEHTIGGGYQYRFDLDRIRDARGNYIEYLWDEQTDNGSGSVYDCDRDFWLTEIRYTGNAAQSVLPQRCIVFNWEARTDFVDRDAPDQSLNYVHRKRLASIEVFGDIARTIRVSKYVFAYGYDSPWWHRVDDQGQDIQVQAAPKLLLVSITRYGADGTSALPATIFAYYSGSDTPIGGWKPKPWLKTADNGYGGRATYDYQYFTPIPYGPVWLKYRARLTSRKWEDLVVTGNPAVVHTYGYSEPSYDFAGAWNGAQRAEFRGHDWVDEVDSLGHYARSYFYTFRVPGQSQNGKADWEIHVLKGRMYEQERYDSANTLLAHDTTDWNYVETGTAADGSKSYFIKLLQQDSYLGSKHKQVQYEYDDTYGTAYGNIVREYFNRYVAGEPQKTVRRGFFADPARWMVGKVSWERVFEGIVTVADGAMPNTWARLRHWGYNPNLDVFHAAAEITNGLVYKTRDYYHQAGQELSILTQYGYDPYGNRNSMTDPNNNTTTYVWDATYHAFLTKSTYPGGTVYEERGYDLGRGLLTSINDSNHVPSSNDTRTLYEYDTFGRPLKIIRPGDTLASPTVEHTYRNYIGTPWFQPYRIETRRKKNGTDPVHKTRAFYDGLGRELQRYSDGVEGGSPRWIFVNTHYNSRGLVEWESLPYYIGWDPVGDFHPGVWNDTSVPRSQYGWDALRRPTTVTNPDGSHRDTAYRGWEMATTDENQHQKKQTMDAFGRLVRVDEYQGAFPTPNLDATPYATTIYGYNILDNLASIKDALDASPSTTITWNELSRKTQMTDPDMGAWKYQQDASGNIIRQEDARGKVIRIGYDALNRPRRKTYWKMVSGQEQIDGTWADDPLTVDNTIGIYDIAEIRAAINANRIGAGLPGMVWEGILGETDPDNRTFIAGRTTVRAVHFNEMRNAVRELPGMSGKQFEQLGTDVNLNLGTSNPISVRDPQNLRTWIQEHETGNGVASRVYIRYDNYSDGVSRNNAKGRRTEMWDATGHTIWYYDARGRVMEERRYIDGKVYVTRYEYDAMDRATRITYPDNEEVNITYNAQLLLDSMIGASTYIAAGTGYNTAGQPTGVTYGNGVVTTMGYHPQTFRLTSISVPAAGLSLDYLHLPNGNISRITDGGVANDFGYDELDRLISASGAYWGSYTIDQIGRMLSKVEGNTSHSYQYAGSGHKHAPSSVDGSPQGYDENGNLVASSGFSLKYNGENQMVKVSQGSAYVARFGVDGDGQRRKRVDAFGAVHYPGPHYERNVGTNASPAEVVTKLYWAQLGPYRRLVAVRRVVVGVSDTLHFLHHDHLGSTKAISGTTGGPMKYYPFGYAYQQIQNPPTDNLYTGQKSDPSTGLYFYGARYLNPAIATFLQPDSIVPRPGDPQSLNRYAYGRNNPLNHTDPTGRSEEGPGYQPDEEGPFYVFIGGYGTNDQADPGQWDPMISNLGLKPGQYTYFDWGSGWSGQGTASIDRSTADAAPELARQIGDRKNVVLVGHSKGGALIMEYLAGVAEGKISAKPNVKRAFAIDSPLRGGALSEGALFDRADRIVTNIGPIHGQDRLAGLPERLAQRGLTVDIATLDNPNDWVGHFPISGIPYYSVPLGGSFAGHVSNVRGVHGLLMQYAWSAQIILQGGGSLYASAW